MSYDLAVIGGGIVGLATALQVITQFPGMSVAVIEREAGVAWHQSGRNSGVIHAGVYYAPGSLKARFCREGRRATIEFCRSHGIPVDQCGKLLVATSETELGRMQGLRERCVHNNIHVETLSASELSDVEPAIRGVGALLVNATGVVDFARVAESMAQLFVDRRGEIRLESEVVAIEEIPSGVFVHCNNGSVHAKHVIACAGIMADRLLKMSGLPADFQMVPFRGEFFKLSERWCGRFKRLVYPIPDPALPFLGVHITRTIDGATTVGPNAVLALSRYGYQRSQFDLGDLQEMLRFEGFRKLVRSYWREGFEEIWSSLSKKRYLSLCRRYCPDLELGDLEPYRSGIRAQAVMADGSLAQDFLIRASARVIHVCNAPSPAATAAIPIATELVRRAEESFGWPATFRLQVSGLPKQ